MSNISSSSNPLSSSPTRENDASYLSPSSPPPQSPLPDNLSNPQETTLPARETPPSQVRPSPFDHTVFKNIRSLSKLKIDAESVAQIPLTAAQTELFNQIHSHLTLPAHRIALVDFLTADSSAYFFGTSNPSANAILLALSQFQFSEPDRILHVFLNSVDGAGNRDPNRFAFVGQQLLFYSLACGGNGRNPDDQFPAEITERAADIFAQANCSSLKYEKEFAPWVEFLARQIDREQAFGLVDALAHKLNNSYSMSGYGHILAVLSESPHHAAAMAYADSLSNSKRLDKAIIHHKMMLDSSHPLTMSSHSIKLFAVLCAAPPLMAMAMGASDMLTLGRHFLVLFGTCMALRYGLSSAGRSLLELRLNKLHSYSGREIDAWNEFHRKVGDPMR